MNLLVKICVLSITLQLAACAAPIHDWVRGTATPDRHAVDIFESPNNGYGIGGNLAVTAIGGGEGYGEWVEEYSVVVSTADELLNAIEHSRAGDVIYVDERAAIDLTGVWDTRIPDGVTLASGRGREGSLGALLYTTENENKSLFEIRGNGVRITGLRLQGPSTEVNPGGCPRNARGITIRGVTNQPVVPTVEIDNNELWGWPNSAISIVQMADVHVHHNYIHHNRREVEGLDKDPENGCASGGYGLGYGVNISGTHVFIDANLFDYNRHDIASSGSPGSGYTARYNLVLSHGASHSFDMHGYGEQRSIGAAPPYEAGEKIVIHHNAFLLVEHPAIVIRGIPKTGAWIYQNQFAGPEETIMQRNTNATGEESHPPNTVNMHVEDNQYGVGLDPR